MKVGASVKKICRNCKVIRRKNVRTFRRASAGTNFQRSVQMRFLKFREFLKNNVSALTVLVIAVVAALGFPFAVPVKSASLATDLIAFFGMPAMVYVAISREEFSGLIRKVLHAFLHRPRRQHDLIGRTDDGFIQEVFKVPTKNTINFRLHKSCIHRDLFYW